MGFYFFAWPDCLEGGEGQEPRIRLSPEAAKYSQFRHKGNPSHQQILSNSLLSQGRSFLEVKTCHQRRHLNWGLRNTNNFSEMRWLRDVNSSYFSCLVLAPSSCPFYARFMTIPWFVQLFLSHTMSYRKGNPVNIPFIPVSLKGRSCI